MRKKKPARKVAKRPTRKVKVKRSKAKAISPPTIDDEMKRRFAEQDEAREELAKQRKAARKFKPKPLIPDMNIIMLTELKASVQALREQFNERFSDELGTDGDLNDQRYSRLKTMMRSVMCAELQQQLDRMLPQLVSTIASRVREATVESTVYIAAVAESMKKMASIPVYKEPKQ